MNWVVSNKWAKVKGTFNTWNLIHFCIKQLFQLNLLTEILFSQITAKKQINAQFCVGYNSSIRKKVQINNYHVHKTFDKKVLAQKTKTNVDQCLGVVAQSTKSNLGFCHLQPNIP